MLRESFDTSVREPVLARPIGRSYFEEFQEAKERFACANLDVAVSAAEVPSVETRISVLLWGNCPTFPHDLLNLHPCPLTRERRSRPQPGLGQDLSSSLNSWST